MDKIKGLYFIKDLRTDKVIYIGQTSDFEGRKKQHFYNKISHIDKYMYEEGRDNFSMKMFSDIDCTNMTEEERRIKEDELILQYDTIDNGFNKRRSGLISIDKIKYCNEKRRERKISDPDYKDKLKEYSKKSRLKNKEKYNEYKKQYYQEHREEIRQYQKEQYQKHKEKRLKYNQEHREEINKYKRAYRKKKKEQSLINTKTDD